MWKLDDCRAVFVCVGLIGVLLLAWPTWGWVLHLSAGEKFSELWVLGPGHMAEDYPFNVVVNQSYKVFVGVGNHMGSSAYYVVYVKFRNQSEPLPNATSGSPSPLSALYEYRVVIQEGEVWEVPLTFSFPLVSRYENICLVEGLTINDVMFSVYKPALWDANNMGYYFQLFIELWIYNVESKDFEFHNRFVGLWFNMTG